MRPLLPLLCAGLAACPGDDPKAEPEAPASLAEAPIVVRGDAGDLAGSALAMGDLDGEGAQDLVVAGLGGRITCVLPAIVTAGEHRLRASAACVGQAADYDFAGYAVASGADVDGDGVDDLLVGAPGTDGAGDAAGAVGLLHGPLPAGVTPVDAGVSWGGGAAADALGTAVAFAGDPDGDGDEDLLFGAPGGDAGARDAGAALLVDPLGGALADATIAAFVGGGGPAPDTTAKHAENVLGDGVGNAVCRARDLDGDGVHDVVIPAPGWDGGAENAGAVAIYAGPVAEGTWTLAEADTLLLGTAAGGYAGGTVACGGDTDGDGRTELLVGADGDGAGRVYLWRAGALGDAGAFVGTVTGDQAGYAVAFVPGDGEDGVAIGAPSADDAAVDAGVVAYFAAPHGSGTVDLVEADARWAGTGAGDLAGAALLGVVDFVGIPALLVGAPYNRDGAPIGGAAYWVALP